MWVFGLLYFAILATTFSTCAIGLKSPLGPPNFSDQDSITWDYINIILNNTLGALDQLLLHLEGTNKITKYLSEFFGRYDTKSNASGNATQTMTKVEATSDLKQCFNNITGCLDDAKKEGGHLWWFPIIANSNRYNSQTIGDVKKQHAGLISY